MRIKTADLIGPALDWAVAQCEGKIYGYKHQLVDDCRGVIPYTPSTDWSQGGPIIEREVGTILSTPLIAAMRCYVAATLGEEVDIPEELLS